MSKIRKNSKGFGYVYQREIGNLSPKNFKNRLGASEDLVLRFGIDSKLDLHRGCVNTVSFNDDGEILISGSDDRMIILWDWDAGKSKFSFHSGHSNNVFDARFMPFSNDKSVVTSSADGEVRHAMICDGGSVNITKLSQHAGQVHKLALELGSPYVFYSCAEDGVVQHFDLRTKASTVLFLCKDDDSVLIPLNDISLDPRNPCYFAVGGGDRYARLYDIRRYRSNMDALSGQPCDFFCPPGFDNDNDAMITGLTFSNKSELLVSYRDENVYLFLKDQGLGTEPLQLQSIDDENCPRSYKGHHNCFTVKGVNFYGPNCDYVVSGSDCGRIFMWRKKDGELLRAMEGDKHVVNCIVPHPYSTAFASSGIENNIKIWTPNSEPATPVDIDAILKADRGRSLFFDDIDVGMDYDSYYDSDDDDDDIDEDNGEGFDDEDEDIDGDDYINDLEDSGDDDGIDVLDLDSDDDDDDEDDDVS